MKSTNLNRWLAHNYRRQIGLKLAERRIDAYMSLWTVLAATCRQGKTVSRDILSILTEDRLLVRC